MIIIDGQKASMNIEHYANLEEILVQAGVECNKEKRIITDVFLNDEQFSEIYPHQAEDIERDEIRSVEIRSVPLGEMALNITDELFKVTRMLCDGSREIALLFRQGDDQQALDLFQDLLNTTRDFMSMVGVLRSDFVEVSDPEFVSLVEKLSGLLGEINEVLASEDWILLSDLLEYEFLPVCEQWNTVLQSMRTLISKTLD